MNLTTPIEIAPVHPGISYQNKILMLGSCFADEVGRYLKDYRFETMVNPFGTLYNPCSIAHSVKRLASEKAFTSKEVILSGGIYTSFSHHSSVSGSSVEAFLATANAKLSESANFFQQADTFFITLGTAYVYRNLATGEVVSNCHKVKKTEFERSLLSVAECVTELKQIVEIIKRSTENVINKKDKCSKEGKCANPTIPSTQIVFTISPIRHLKDGAHGNQISKATLLLAVEELLISANNTPRIRLCYFPSYELMMDELRDYRFYATDMIHPSLLAVEYIFERFKDNFISKECYPLMREAMRLTKAENHRPLFPDTQEYACFLKKLEQNRHAFLQKIHALP